MYKDIQVVFVISDYFDNVLTGESPVNVKEDIPPVLLALSALHKIVIKEFNINR